MLTKIPMVSSNVLVMLSKINLLYTNLGLLVSSLFPSREFNGQELLQGAPPAAIAWVTFSADVEHEVALVTSGHRITIVQVSTQKINWWSSVHPYLGVFASSMLIRPGVGPGYHLRPVLKVLMQHLSGSSMILGSTGIYKDDWRRSGV